MPPVGSNLNKGVENEQPLMQARMGNGQAGFVDNSIAVEQQVKVEQSRPPAHFLRPGAAVRSFDGEQTIKQFARREAGRDEDRAIQVCRLRSGADWIGLVPPTDGQHCRVIQRMKMFNRAVEQLRAFPEIRTERDGCLNRLYHALADRC